MGWAYLRGLLFTQDLASLGYSIPMLMCNKEGETPGSWYTATGLLGQGRGVLVFAVEAGKVSSLMGTIYHSWPSLFEHGWPSLLMVTALTL